MSRKKDITIDDLALMIKGGFDNNDKNFEKVNTKIDNIEIRMENLEQGQEDIRLRLTNVAYRFEVEELKLKLSVLEAKYDKKFKQLAKKFS